MGRSGRYPNHVLNDWFEYSGTIAEAYYLQTTEDDYAEALREIAASESHSVGTSARGQDPSLEISAKEKPHKTGTLITVDGFWIKPSVHLEGVSLVPENTTEIFKCRFRGPAWGPATR